MKKIFNIQNRIVARADNTMEEATVIIELSVHMSTVDLTGLKYESSALWARPLDTVAAAIDHPEPVTAPGCSWA